jgi:hypothetical protein
LAQTAMDSSVRKARRFVLMSNLLHIQVSELTQELSEGVPRDGCDEGFKSLLERASMPTRIWCPMAYCWCRVLRNCRHPIGRACQSLEVA